MTQKLWLLIFSLLLLVTHNKAEKIESYHFDRQSLRFERENNYHKVYYKNFDYSYTIGQAQLPFKLVSYAEPIDSIIILDRTYEKVKTGIRVYPVQKPTILSKKNKPIKFTPLVKQKGKYPEYPIDLLTKNNFRLFPLKYNYESGDLFLLTHIKIKIITTAKPQEPLASPMNTAIDYLVISADSMASAFSPLLQWKLKKGIIARFISTETVATDYSGIDLQEKIRNCISDYYHTHGLTYVLLGGDTDIIPDRKTWAFDCEAGIYSDENDIPCDLYYSDIDGNWDANENGIYGEIDDNIDLIPDVFVGRAPVESITETYIFIEKVLSYEKATTTDYQENMLFLCQVLWGNPYTDSGKSKDLIDSLYIPAYMNPITKLYQSKGNVNKPAIMESINTGANFINHNGHAGYSIMSVGDAYIRYSDVLQMTNRDRYGILYSIGCWPAAIDRDAIAEDFVTQKDGGTVAFIGNSRYGWGSPGNPLFGYSDRFDQQFYRQLFQQSIYNIGKTLAAAKAYYAPLSREENVYRWCQYEINLLGDPEMPIFTKRPMELSVNFPAELPEGKQYFNITVKDENGAVENARVCLSQPEKGILITAHTAIDGIANIDINVNEMFNKFYLTVTAHNHIPYEDSITVKTNAPFFSINYIETDPIYDHGFKIDTTQHISAFLVNTGLETATNVKAILSSELDDITITDNTVAIDKLASDNSIFLDDIFSYQLTAPVQNGTPLPFTIKIDCDETEQRQHNFSIHAKTPDLVVNSLNFSSTPLQPGDIIHCIGDIRNAGDAFCENYDIIFPEHDHYEVTNLSFSTDGLAPGNMDTLNFDLALSDELPEYQSLTIPVKFQASSGFIMETKFLINVGECGLEENFETELSDNWILPNQKENQWHRSTYRKNSGDYAFYCGNEATQKYDFHCVTNALESDYFYPGKTGKLSFFCWYKFPNYGTSGLTVEVLDSTVWRKLDFIGSGGALTILPTGNTWLPYEYDLSFLPKMTKSKVRFTVTLDSTEAPTEGLYLDDIKVTDKLITLTSTEPSEPVAKELTLFQNYPNPFNANTKIKFSLPTSGRVIFTIYNLRGQEVKRYTTHYKAGLHVINWQPTELASGVYFYQIKTDNFIDVKKSLYIK